jgi:cellobiose phosphorylase
MAYAELGDIEKAWEITSMINPINHSRSEEEVAKYKVEPYVVAADVYASKQHAGRGGWTWYTGSAGWMYRLITESLLGLRLETDKLYVEPRIPLSWNSFKIHYRFRDTMYHLSVTRLHDGEPGPGITSDGVEVNQKFILLVDDRKDHNVEIKYISGNHGNEINKGPSEI